MKKNNYWIACFLLLSVYFKAQYFQGKYAQDAWLGATCINGMATRGTGDGHLLGGLNIRSWSNGACNDYAFFVTRVGVSGAFFNPGEFNTSYIIYDSKGKQLRFSSSEVVEYANGSGYGVVFTYFPNGNAILCPGSGGPGNLNQSALGFARLDAMGNVLNYMGYGFPAQGSAYVQGITESPTAPNHVLVTGSFGGEHGQFWAARIDQAGNMIWGNLYGTPGQSMSSFDIINAPGMTDVVIVGGVSAAGGSDAFILDVDLNTGAAIQCKTFRNGTGNGFQAIKVHPGWGYVVGGIVDGDCWMVRLDWAFNTMWWQKIQVVGKAGQIRNANGLGVRTNSGGNVEYYIGATMVSATVSDAIILKLDQNGNPVGPGSVFVYDTGAEETVVGLDMNTSGTWDGLGLYGVVEGSPNPTNREGFVIKSYFNGVTDCNTSFMNANPIPTQMTFGTLLIAQTPLGPSYPFGTYTTYSNIYNLLCNNPQVPGDNNFRSAAATGMNSLSMADAEALGVFPNPCAANEQLKLQVPSQKDETVTIKITNLLGSVVHVDQADVTAGPNHITLNLASAKLATGMYQVSVEGQNGIQTQKLLIK
jgi:hypothetical protein